VYAGLDDLKAELRLTTGSDDARLTDCLAAAKASVDQVCGRTFSPPSGTSARIYRAHRDMVWHDDSSSAPTLVEESDDMVTWSSAVGLWLAEPDTPYRAVRRITGTWRRYARVTAAWGWAAVPPQVQRATVLQAIRLFKRADSPEGVLATDFGSVRMARIDPDVLALLRPLKRAVIG
jgi:hypothetical protein